MSLVRSGINKLRIAGPLMQSQKRNFAYGFNHVIAGPPMVRVPFAEKMFMGTLFCVGMVSYPLYVVYMMPIWDEMDGNVPPTS